MTLDEAKVAAKRIIQIRHAHNGTSATADLARIDAATDIVTAWTTANAILAVLPTSETLGCCTYTIDGQTFHIPMTRTECDQTPNPHSFGPPGPPCPP
jgi:hypothetical protein